MLPRQVKAFTTHAILLLFPEMCYNPPLWRNEGLSPVQQCRTNIDSGGSMQKEELLKKTEQAVSPFETENIVNFIKTLTFKSAMENPWIIGIFLLIFFYAVIKRSKPVLLFLFAAISIMLLVRFTLPHTEGNELTLSSTLPFAFGGLLIGGVLIYFSFIKGD